MSKTLILIILAVVLLLVSTLTPSDEEESTMEWEEAIALYETPLAEVLAIIDDAETNGFEFKRVGDKLYYRERCTEQ